MAGRTGRRSGSDACPASDRSSKARGRRRVATLSLYGPRELPVAVCGPYGPPKTLCDAAGTDDQRSTIGCPAAAQDLTAPVRSEQTSPESCRNACRRCRGRPDAAVLLWGRAGGRWPSHRYCPATAQILPGRGVGSRPWEHSWTGLCPTLCMAITSPQAPDEKLRALLEWTASPPPPTHGARGPGMGATRLFSS